MKSLRILATASLLFVSIAALAQSDAKSTFERLQTLNGTWEGKNSQGEPLKVSFRPTSGGTAILSEITGKGEDMITMFHMDNNRVLMTHYCGAGNQPRMQASISPDGKTITFTFVDATNLATPKAGHMDRLVLTIPDADHHTEEWTFVMDGKEMKEHFELTRAKAAM
jgi:hypothetical protein